MEDSVPGMQLKRCVHLVPVAIRMKQRASSALGLKQVACAGCQRRATKRLVKLRQAVFSTVA